jgi:hypothetical protein
MQSDNGVLFAFNFDRVEGLGVSGLSTGIERLLEINVSNLNVKKVSVVIKLYICLLTIKFEYS